MSRPSKIITISLHCLSSNSLGRINYYEHFHGLDPDPEKPYPGIPDLESGPGPGVQMHSQSYKL